MTIQTNERPRNIAVLTSGGDSQGMNAAVRAVVRAGISRGVEVYAIYNGYQGMVEGGHQVRNMAWGDVGGILHQGGTVIGTARCAEFRTREGRLKAALNLIEKDIDRLVVIGGDGSLTGADIFRQEWSGLLAELAERGEITAEQAAHHANLRIVGLVGSIDNDMFGTDMTIGADTALHRIVEAVDALASTAASHMRTFVVEVMGRHSGYLALMSAIATGANYVLIPENPPTGEHWEDEMCEVIAAGRQAGRRHSIVIVAEGATDRQGNPIESDYIKRVLEEKLHDDTRVTILGHVQRGGTPSAFDRWHSTLLGYAAVTELLDSPTDAEPKLIGLRQHDVVATSLMTNVVKTQEVAKVIAAHDYEQAMAMRGGSFAESYRIFRTLLRAHPREVDPRQRQLRILVMHGGGPAPGMNTAIRAAVRLGLDKGNRMLAAYNGFEGLAAGDVREMNWMSVHGMVAQGGAELGTSRHTLVAEDLTAIADNLEKFQVDAILMIGGLAGYRGLYAMMESRKTYAAFNIPMICMPASINNNLPGSEQSVGADTALNGIVLDVDKIKQSAVATRRVFVVEVMGRDSGYLALMSGLAAGAERVYLPEKYMTLTELEADTALLRQGFEHGKRLGLIIRNENADRIYNTDFVVSVLEREGGDVFDVRKAVLGHVQQGGTPSPFDRIQATRLTSRCIDYLMEEAGQEPPGAAMIGLIGGKVTFTDLAFMPALMDGKLSRPKNEWWMRLLPIARTMAQSPDGE
ncbi:MAG: 6-phosphofructokinase [Anaerolineae bacterium]